MIVVSHDLNVKMIGILCIDVGSDAHRLIIEVIDTKRNSLSVGLLKEVSLLHNNGFCEILILPDGIEHHALIIGKFYPITFKQIEGRFVLILLVHSIRKSYENGIARDLKRNAPILARQQGLLSEHIRKDHPIRIKGNRLLLA